MNGCLVTATVGLRAHRPDQCGRLEDDPLATDRRGEHGPGVQEVRQGDKRYSLPLKYLPTGYKHTHTPRVPCFSWRSCTNWEEQTGPVGNPKV